MTIRPAAFRSLFLLAAIAFGATEAVAQSDTATTLSSSLNPSVYGQSVRFTATVAGLGGGAPAGEVTFKDGSTVLGTGALTVITGGTQIAAGPSHACALTVSGSVKCWGSNWHGELGVETNLGTYNPNPVPVEVPGLTGIVALSANESIVCALTSAGGVKCWGWNRHGQLGSATNYGTDAANTTPLDVEGLTSGVKAIAAGQRFTCALTTAGGVKCWGSNSYGAIGTGISSGLGPNNVDVYATSTPLDIPGVTSGVAAISAGAQHVCALMETGTVKCWGSNSFGQLGNSEGTGQFGPHPTPQEVAGLSDVAGISAGGNHTCALTNAGGIKCWGYNAFGQLGNPNNVTGVFGTAVPNPVPADVTGLTSGVKVISTGFYHTCALLESGEMNCWGNPANGRLGNPDNTDQWGTQADPLVVQGLSGPVVSIAAGAEFTCVVYESGGMACWGNNYYGQLATSFQVGNTGTAVLPQPITNFGGEATVYSTASITTAAVLAGTRTITAEYAGSEDHNGSSDSLTQTVSKATPTVTLSAPSLTMPYTNATMTLTATVSPADATGAVTYFSQNYPISGGTVDLTLNQPNPGPITVDVVYGGDDNYNGATSNSLTIVTTRPPDITSSGDETFTIGTAGSFTVTTGSMHYPTAVTLSVTGTLPSDVSFIDNGDGTATISGTPGAGTAGDYPVTITASNGINPDATQEFILTVNRAASTIALGAPNPATSVYGQPVVLTATVTSGAGGSITFMRGATSLGSATISGTTATLTTAVTALPVGTSAITASYSGDGSFGSSTSSSTSVTVSKAATTATLTATPATARPGQVTKLVADVAASAPSEAVVIGTVTFKQGNTVLGTKPLVAGKATLNTLDLEIGTNAITASFAATANFTASNANGTAKVTPKLGAEFLVNTTTENVQTTPSIARLTGNAFIVVWASNAQDGAGYGIYGQRYKNNGAKAGAEFRVNTTTAGAQTAPVVASLKDGSFVVVWTSPDTAGTGISAQMYKSNGVRQGTEFKVNTTLAGNQSTPVVAGFADGSFVIAWTSPDGAGQGTGVSAQRYNATGGKLGKEVRVNTTTAGNQAQPAVAALASGAFVIVWQADDGIYGQRYKANGAVSGAQFLVSAAAGDAQTSPSVSGTPDSGFVIAWQSGATPDVVAQRYRANGAKFGAAFVVNTRTAGAQTAPAISAFDDGGFVVFWTSADGSGSGVFGQIYLADGTRNGGEFDVNTTTANNQSQPALVATSDGNFAGVWTSRNQDGSSDGIYGQRFNAPVE